MGFINEVESNSAKFKLRLEVIRTEEATKNALVMPFIKMLGYETEDPTEVEPEYIADFGVKKGEKVDYAVLRDGNPIILIEAKKYGEVLTVSHEDQLFRYFTVTDARFAILTDGISYRFYSDLDKPNKMDDSPFFVFNMLDFSPEQVEQLRRFRKDEFKPEQALEAAHELRYTNGIKQVLNEEMDSPSEEFVKFLLNRMEFPEAKSKLLIEKLMPIVKRAFRGFAHYRVKVSSESATYLENKRDEPLKHKENPHISEPGLSSSSYLLLKSSGVEARGYQAGSSFIVLAGSKARKHEKASTPQNAVSKRKELIDNGVFKDLGSSYEFTQDQEFNSPSEAACVICGRSESGNRIWKQSSDKNRINRERVHEIP